MRTAVALSAAVRREGLSWNVWHFGRTCALAILRSVCQHRSWPFSRLSFVAVWSESAFSFSMLKFSQGRGSKYMLSTKGHGNRFCLISEGTSSKTWSAIV